MVSDILHKNFSTNKYNWLIKIMQLTIVKQKHNLSALFFCISGYKFTML